MLRRPPHTNPRKIKTVLKKSFLKVAMIAVQAIEAKMDMGPTFLNQLSSTVAYKSKFIVE